MPFNEWALSEVEQIVFSKKENVINLIYEGFFSYHGIPPTGAQINRVIKQTKNKTINPDTIKEILLQS